VVLRKKFAEDSYKSKEQLRKSEICKSKTLKKAIVVIEAPLDIVSKIGLMLKGLIELLVGIDLDSSYLNNKSWVNVSKRDQKLNIDPK
ncbi:28583_t:CDS:2, partial [Gigaspora margarita]